MATRLIIEVVLQDFNLLSPSPHAALASETKDPAVIRKAFLVGGCLGVCAYVIQAVFRGVVRREYII